MKQQSRPNAPCLRCPSPHTVRLRKTRRTDNHVFRCPRCGLIFSPAIPSRLPVRPEVAGPALHPPHKTKNPKLNSYPNAASKTTLSCPKDVLQLRPEPGAAPQSAPNRLPQLRHQTTKSKLDSYPNAAIETTSSYEKTILSYDSGRTVADWTAPDNTPADRR